MVTTPEWRDSYLTAAQETDWRRMPERIKDAQSAIGKRQLLLLADHGGTSTERQEIANALVALNVLREEVASWQSRAAQSNDQLSPDPVGISPA